MEIRDILSRVDHTLLKQFATFDDIKALCDDAIAYSTASVCIPPCFVEAAKDYFDGKMKICTVIGFPNGYNAAPVKIFETYDAIRHGADEVDVVVNIGDVKAGNYDKVLTELKEIRSTACEKIMKVIIETCYLSEEEKIRMCEVVTASGADFIKTSTGFGTGGATLEDVILLRKTVGANVKVKAAGGIRTLGDAKLFIEAGADRLGTSAIVRLVKEGAKL